MGCSCGKPEEVVLKHLTPLCRECFISLLKKRVERELRGFQKDQKVLLVLHNDAASHLLKKVFAAIAENRHRRYAFREARTSAGRRIRW